MVRKQPGKYIILQHTLSHFLLSSPLPPAPFTSCRPLPLLPLLPAHTNFFAVSASSLCFVGSNALMAASTLSKTNLLLVRAHPGDGAAAASAVVAIFAGGGEMLTTSSICCTDGSSADGSVGGADFGDEFETVAVVVTVVLAGPQARSGGDGDGGWSQPAGGSERIMPGSMGGGAGDGLGEGVAFSAMGTIAREARFAYNAGRKKGERKVERTRGRRRKEEEGRKMQRES